MGPYKTRFPNGAMMFQLPWLWEEGYLQSYCWWKKSCTSWYGEYPIIYRVSYMSGGAGFLPSTVSPKFKNCVFTILSRSILFKTHTSTRGCVCVFVFSCHLFIKLPSFRPKFRQGTFDLPTSRPSNHTTSSYIVSTLGHFCFSESDEKIPLPIGSMGWLYIYLHENP